MDVPGPPALEFLPPRIITALSKLALRAGSGESRRARRAQRKGYRRCARAVRRAWLADDTAAVLRVFAEDAVLIPHLGNPQVKGHAAIRNHFWPPNSPPARTIVFERTSDEINGSGDLAWDRGRYALAFVWQGDTIRQSGNYLTVSERGADGAWRWVAYTWNHR